MLSAGCSHVSQGEVNEASAASEAEAHGEEVTDGHGRGSLEKAIHDDLCCLYKPTFMSMMYTGDLKPGMMMMMMMMMFGTGIVVQHLPYNITGHWAARNFKSTLLPLKAKSKCYTLVNEYSNGTWNL